MSYQSIFISPPLVMLLVSTLFLLLVPPATTLGLGAAGDLVLVGNFRQGVCTPYSSVDYDPANGCFDLGVPSVGCRKSSEPCESRQMKAAVLEVDVSGSCRTFTWRWTCTPDTLIHCVDHLWCDPLAHCNATAESCTCQGNLTGSGTECGCDNSSFIEDLQEPFQIHVNGPFVNVTCRPTTTPCRSPDIESAPPTSTSDRVCVRVKQVPGGDDDEGLENWQIVMMICFGVAVALGIIAIVIILVLAAKSNRVGDVDGMY